MDLKLPKFDELKDRFGLSDQAPQRTRTSSRHAAHDDSYNDSYDDFGQEDFGEYAFDDNADYAREPRKDAASTGSFTPQMPKLVTADDVRAHTQYTPSDPADADARTTDRDAASKPETQRSPGLNGLFDPQATVRIDRPVVRTAADAEPAPSAAQTGAFAAVRNVPAMPEPAVEQPAAAPAQPRVVQRATRILTVIKPDSYDDAERIAKILKSGDVAILSLRNTPDALGKRILDFSFGVACALDAHVECVSGHVFALTRGAGLTDGELGRLRDQGLM